MPRGTVIDEYTKEEVVKALNKGKTQKEVAEKFKICIASVAKIKKESAKIIKIKKIDSEKEKVVIEENKVQVIDCSDNNVLKVGLISDRHDMPVTDNIFEKAIPQEKFFDFDYYDDTVRKFIREKVISKESGTKKDLVVYCTGLTSATASVVKVCFEMDVNLTLMHFNTDRNNGNYTYNPQVIYDKNKTIDEEKTNLKKIFSTTNSMLYVYNGITSDKIKSGIGLFAVKMVTAINKKPIIDYYVFDNIADAYRFIMQNTSIYSKKDGERISVYLEEGKYDKSEGIYKKNDTILRLHNFDMLD